MKEVSYRKINSVDMESFRNDILSSELYCSDLTISKSGDLDLDCLATSYNTILGSIVNQHAPVITKTIISRPCVPWFNDEIRRAKRLRRKSERRWGTTRLQNDYDLFKLNKNRVTFLMNRARREYFTNLINENSRDQRKLFTVCRSLLGCNKSFSLPSHVNDMTLANEMGNFFEIRRFRT